MRIVCNTLDDFMANLEGKEVFDKTIWVTFTRNRVTEAVYHTNFQASAIIVFVGGGEGLVEFGENTGPDFDDATQKFEGTEKGKQLKMEIQSYCDSNGLQIKPGMLDMG